MHRDCRNCQKNYNGECRPSDVAECIRHGRPTKWQEMCAEKVGLPSGEFCPWCGADISYQRSLTGSKKFVGIPRPRLRDCRSCGRSWVTGEYAVMEYVKKAPA